jgi:PAS domain S-box-containing protein
VEVEHAECVKDRLEQAQQIGQLQEAVYRLGGTASRAVVGADKAGVVTDWSRGAEALFGYAAREMIGQPLLVLVPGRLRGKHQDGYAAVAAGSKMLDPTKPIQAVARAKDGTEVEISAVYSMWKDKLGEPHFEATITRR